jgi:peroxiredoxin (alkyl hydroperoxide reductase subunit C)
MSAKVGLPAPAFNVPALVGTKFENVSLQQYLDQGKWVVLFFYPKDFTFVCPTEIVSFNEHHEAFAERNAVVIGASTDTVNSHLGWTKLDERLSGLKYPILGDLKKEVTTAYGVLHEAAGIALRGTFIIDPQGKLQWSEVNNLDVGRNVDEVVRVLDALQTGGLCAVNWKKGDKNL